MADGDGQGGAGADQGAGDWSADDWVTKDTAAHPSSPILHLAGFDGLMDLLLDLAERQRIDLGMMSVRALAEQFVAALEAHAATVPIEQRADWLVVATRLVLLHSRLFCPPDPEAAATAEQEAAAVLRNLDALTAARRLGAWLAARPQQGIEVFGRGTPPAPRVTTGYVALMEACLVALQRGHRASVGGAPYAPVIPDLWRIADAIDRIRTMLAMEPGGGALGTFLPELDPDHPQHSLKTRAAVASTFSASLELAKEGALQITQETLFGAMVLQAALGEDLSHGQLA